MDVDFSLPFAGMAAPLPLESKFVQRASASVEVRLQAISFFVLVLLACTLVVWALWNYLRRDLTWMPRLSFGKALAGVVLWGLLAFVVLTMISGARELMTPGAWKKDGLTYKLASESADDEDALEARRRNLERLRDALWRHAATHGGKFPTAAEADAMPPAWWEVPDAAGLRYEYRPGLTATGPPQPLAWEPELGRGRRLVLRSDGEIVPLAAAELAERTGGEGGR